MPQSLSKIYLHLVFGTKNRLPWLRETLRDQLHSYSAWVLDNLGCNPILINSVDDHIHLLFALGRTVSVSRVVEEVKTSSSKWLKTQEGVDISFAWQSGYGCFLSAHPGWMRSGIT